MEGFRFVQWVRNGSRFCVIGKRFAICIRRGKSVLHGDRGNCEKGWCI